MDADGYIKAARAYVEAAERCDSVESLVCALARVYAAALEMTPVAFAGPDYEPPDVAHSEWGSRFSALGKLLGSTSYHDFVSNWTDVSRKPELGMGDLADDLADVWRDLKSGVIALDSGVPPKDVLYQWDFDFRIHWGEHASRAISVLHTRLPQALP